MEVILVEEKNNVFADLGPYEARTHDVGVITTTVCRVSERPGQWSVCLLLLLKPFETDLLEYPWFEHDRFEVVGSLTTTPPQVSFRFTFMVVKQICWSILNDSLKMLSFVLFYFSESFFRCFLCSTLWTDGLCTRAEILLFDAYDIECFLFPIPQLCRIWLVFFCFLSSFFKSPNSIFLVKTEHTSL